MKMTMREEPAGKTEMATAPAQQVNFFNPDKADLWLAGVTFVLGFLFMRWVFFAWQGWGVALYTALFIAVVLFYVRQKGKRMAGEAWFWFAVLLLTALSFALWPGHGVFLWRSLLLFGAAIYWVRMAAGATLCGKTSDWLPLDLLCAIFYTPLKNLSAQYSSLAVVGKKQRVTASKLWPVVLGVLLAAVVISVVGPLLLRADAGGFALLLRNLQPQLERLGRIDSLLLIQMVLAIPAAAYIYGLLAGSIHDRRVDLRIAESFVKPLRKLPAATAFTLLLLLNGLYVVFIASQLPYFFSAFRGAVPPGWESYAEFARRGFFELCVIAVLNIIILAGTHIGVEIAERRSAALRALSCLLAALTLVLIATAFSKLALYIGIFGLTTQRLLPGVFLIFLAVVFIGVIVRQRRHFSIMRLTAFTGAALLCLLCVINTDSLVAGYNARRYLSGTLREFDTTVLYRAGTAGLSTALLLYEQSDDLQLRRELYNYLAYVGQESSAGAGTLRDTLQDSLARRKMTEHVQKQISR
jgi:hypothetical protein